MIRRLAGSLVSLASLALVLLPPLALFATRTGAEPPADALVGEIPFHPDSPPTRVMIDLAPEENVPFVMMLDTGASGSVLTPGAARAMGVNVRRDRSSPYRKKTRLGRDLQFWVDTRSSDSGSRTGWDYGLLGGEFLDDYVVEIDYPGRTVRFYDPDKFSIPEEASQPDERVLPFRRSGTRILADVEIDGKTVLMLVDTGAPAVLLAGREAKKAGIRWEGLPELQGIGGVLGPIQSYTYTAERVGFGGFEFESQPITIAPRGVYNQGGPTDSAIGYDILGHLVMRIDYRKKRLWLKRGPQREATYWGESQGTTDVSRIDPTPEEVEANDARIAAEWEERKMVRRYVETSIGVFAVVGEARRRNGPNEGEVWYTYDEMLARKKELEQPHADSD